MSNLQHVAALGISGVSLQEQAFAQIAGTDARRVEPLDQRPGPPRPARERGLAAEVADDLGAGSSSNSRSRPGCGSCKSARSARIGGVAVEEADAAPPGRPGASGGARPCSAWRRACGRPLPRAPRGWAGACRTSRRRCRRSLRGGLDRVLGVAVGGGGRLESPATSRGLGLVGAPGRGSRSVPGRSSLAGPSAGSWRISIDWIIRGAMRSRMSMRICCEVSSRISAVPPREVRGSGKESSSRHGGGEPVVGFGLHLSATKTEQILYHRSVSCKADPNGGPQSRSRRRRNVSPPVSASASEGQFARPGSTSGDGDLVQRIPDRNLLKMRS